MKKYDVTALGELLIDFTESGISPQGNPLLEANPGGAPCNVLAMLSKLGKRTAFIGKVGADMFGRQLSETIKEVGICADGLVADAGVPTTLAFVHTFAGGEREFSFIRNPGADMMLTRQEVRTDLIRDSRIFHFGTLSSTHAGVREATRFAIDTAIESGAMLSFFLLVWQLCGIALEPVSCLFIIYNLYQIYLPFFFFFLSYNTT